MGRNWHGPILLWAEMTRNRIKCSPTYRDGGDSDFIFQSPGISPVLCRQADGNNPTLSPRGGTLIFSANIGSDPASTIHLKKNIRNFKHPPKIFEILATQKNFPILYIDLKKDPKLHRNDPQTSPILWWPQKNIHKIFIPPPPPQKKIIFLKTPKNI